jgi:plastocyanin
VTRTAALLAIATLVASCGSHAAEPTPTNLRTATLITQTFTPAPTSANSTPEVLTGKATVQVGDRYFVPPQLIVAVGTAVTWVDRGQEEHTSSSREDLWNSGNLDLGASFTFTFTKRGIYQYYCMNHGDMRGQVVVR